MSGLVDAKEEGSVLIVAVDVGTTSIAGSLVNPKGVVLQTYVIPRSGQTEQSATHARERFKTTFRQVLQVIEHLIPEARRRSDIADIGVRVPWPVYPETGALVNRSHVLSRQEAQLAQNIERLFKLPVKVVSTFQTAAERTYHVAADLFPRQFRRQPLRKGVFISYSHKDKKLRDRLKTFLKPYVPVYDDTQIPEGVPFVTELMEMIAAAKVAVLLVTADYLASEFIQTKELKWIVDVHEKRGLEILWIAAGWCLWARSSNLAPYQALNEPTQPLSDLSKPKREKMLATIAAKIVARLEGSAGFLRTTRQVAIPE